MALHVHAQYVVTPDTLFPGYSGAFTITGPGNFLSSTDGVNLRLIHQVTNTTYPFGTLPGGSPWIPWSSFTSNTTLTGNILLPANAPTGAYRVAVEKWGFGQYQTTIQQNNAFQVVLPPSYGTYTGKLIMDGNTNCTHEGTDLPLANRIIEITPGPYYGVTDAAGNFAATLPLGTYTFDPVNVYNATPLCPASGTIAATTTQGQSTYNGVDFYLQGSSQHDLTGCIAVFAHRPGFQVVNYVTVRNDGFGDAPNVVVKVKKPSWMVFNSSVPTHSGINGDTIFWNFPTLAAQTTVSIQLNMTVPVNAGLGMWAMYEVFHSPILNDANPADNSCTNSIAVTGSFDPNDKRVWNAAGANADGPIEPSDSLLRYMIRFQNTGTDTAFNISVRDTLDTDLNYGSLRIVGHSHPYQLLINDSTGRAITFRFPNILLVDSNQNEPLSHGFVEYTIKRKNGLANGTEIRNDASIYFDFNAPVVTNEVVSTICPLLGLGFSNTPGHLQQTFTAQSTGGATSWTWDFGDGTTGTGASTLHSYAAAGTYNVCMIGSSACGRTDTVCQSIVVTCTPVAAGFNNAASGTVDLTVLFTSNSTGPVTAYSWDFGDGATSTAQNPPHTYATPGTYNVCLTVINVCGDTNSHCLTVTPTCVTTPVSTFGYTVNQSTVDFTSPTQTGVTSWNWNFGDGTTSTFQNPSHTYAAAGTYTVCHSAQNICSEGDTACMMVTVTATGSGSLFLHAISVNPNPGTDRMVVHIEMLQLAAGSFGLYDARGRLVESWTEPALQGSYQRVIPVDHLTDGMYLLQLNLADEVHTLRLLKQD